ncbi:MAG: cation:dicarboxylase symporter family transporter, partial [Pseudomonadota bacterium]
MFRRMPIILLISIIILFFIEKNIPLVFKQILYSLSLSIKEVIVFALPIVIFALLFKTILSLSQNATKIIGLILILVCCSNFLSTFLSHYVGGWIYNFDLSMIMPNEHKELVALWNFSLPKLIPNNIAMFGGLLAGLVASKYSKREMIVKRVELVLNYILKGLLYLIPVFVIGFIVKLQHDSTIAIIVQDYSKIFIIIAMAQFGYIILAYFIFNNAKIRSALECIKNMLPAAIVGFSTMSSAATMPLTIMAVEKNSKNKDLARSVVPATVNIHLIGDCFAIPIFAYAILKSYGLAQPSLVNYLIFTFYFVLAKFSVAAVPGGGIIVMLPI